MFSVQSDLRYFGVAGLTMVHIFRHILLFDTILTFPNMPTGAIRQFRLQGATMS